LLQVSWCVPLDAQQLSLLFTPFRRIAAAAATSICHQLGVVGIVSSMLTRYFSSYKHQVTTNMSSPALRKTKSMF
jgi:hypothetical protein